VGIDHTSTANAPWRPAPALPDWLNYSNLRARANWDHVYWLGALVVSFVMAFWLAEVFRGNPVPPGGDPGDWVSTAYAFVGHPFPSQVIPLAYPPALFPLLGAVVLASGSPLTGALVFAALLFFVLALTTFWLAASMLRSRMVAIVVVTFVLVDPAFLAMFFWGAYPNLLGFVFQNLALVGLIRASRGSPTSGALQFWIFGALAVLSESLVGLTLGLMIGLFLGLAFLIPLPDRDTLLRSAWRGTLEAPRLAVQSMFRSWGGKVGLLLFALFVGGFYLATYALRVPHPYYFTSNAIGFRLSLPGTAFQAILPHVFFNLWTVFYASIGIGVFLLVLFVVLRDARPTWLTTPATLLVAWFMALILLMLGGLLLHIVTDYHRFGYLALIPAGLAIGYLVERAWVLRSPRWAPRPPRAQSLEDAEAPGVPAPSSAPFRDTPPPRSTRPPRPWRRAELQRPIAFGVAAAILLILVVPTVTAPAMARDENVFTRVGHDALFLDAIDAIRSAPTHGGVLTVPGADKWVRALSDENAYAPYQNQIYLFYPSQERQSILSFYALSMRDAMTNGLVTASLRGTNPAYADGIPDYSVYKLGNLHSVLRLDPTTVRVEVYDPTTGSLSSVALTGTPSVQMPAGLGSPMTITYAESDFTLTVTVVVSPALAQTSIGVTATGNGSLLVRQVSLALVPGTGTLATVTGGYTPGTFQWKTGGASAIPVTFGAVSPASALQSASNQNSGIAGPAAVIAFSASSATGSSRVTGGIALSSPAASTYLPAIPPILVTPSIWQELGIRFILMRNAAYAPHPTVAFPGEIPYLHYEYNLPILYQNPEWAVFEVPAPAAP
jgi:hypothetical protein